LPRELAGPTSTRGSLRILGGRGVGAEIELAVLRSEQNGRRDGLPGAPEGDEQAVVVAGERLEVRGRRRLLDNAERLPVAHPVEEAVLQSRNPVDHEPTVFGRVFVRPLGSSAASGLALP
jgi:hypothetical protein